MPQIKDFVKHNTEEGFVEIRLYELRDKGRSPVIKRVLSATTNSSTYFLNGKLVPQKEVRRKERGAQKESSLYFVLPRSESLLRR